MLIFTRRDAIFWQTNQTNLFLYSKLKQLYGDTLNSTFKDRR